MPTRNPKKIPTKGTESDDDVQVIGEYLSSEQGAHRSSSSFSSRQSSCIAIDIDALDDNKPVQPTPVQPTRRGAPEVLWVERPKKPSNYLNTAQWRETVATSRHAAASAENGRKTQAQVAQASAAKPSPQTPPLTDAMMNRINEALRITDPKKVLVKGFKLEVTPDDLSTLKNDQWLNDSIINFYFAMLAERSEQNKKLPTIYCFDTFFFKKLEEGYGNVKRWTKNAEVFSKEILLVPVHRGNHWCLAVIDFRKKSIEYYDSLGDKNDKQQMFVCLNKLLNWLSEESIDKRQVKLDTQEWRISYRTDIPQQRNGSDCGMFVCRFAEYVSRGAEINFTQKDMAYFRQRTMYEILEKRLL